jgi:sulfur carrier protein
LHIQVNGEQREVNDGSALPELIAALQLKPQQIAIELNQQVIRRAQWETTVLQEGDKIEIVHFVGGGGALVGQAFLPVQQVARGRSRGLVQ